MEKKILVSLVKKEAAKLKANATKEEIGNLDFKTLNPGTSQDCIYGQMTGNCYSERSGYLILNSCERIFRKNHFADMLDAKIGGRPTRRQMSGRYYKYFSPIEIFILFNENQNNGNNKVLVDYIKGKTKKLAFKKF